jgi:hypothetical protein
VAITRLIVGTMGVVAELFSFLGVVLPILTLSMVFAGLGLYVLSRSFRLLYGLVQITAGILSVV